jgi:hypothetical protein
MTSPTPGARSRPTRGRASVVVARSPEPREEGSIAARHEPTQPHGPHAGKEDVGCVLRRSFRAEACPALQVFPWRRSGGEIEGSRLARGPAARTWIAGSRRVRRARNAVISSWRRRSGQSRPRRPPTAHRRVGGRIR